MAIACAALALCLAAGSLWAKEDPGKKAEPGNKTILSRMTLWRQYYTIDGPVMRKGEQLEKIKLTAGGREVAKWLGVETALPPQGWQKAEFDDGGWLRKPASEPNSPWMKVLCLRGRFHVEDPQKAAGLTLSLRYRGGVAVYLNGKEIARGHLKAGAAPTDLAEDYPAADFTQARELAAIPLPKGDLRKGVNVLAIEAHRSAQLESAVKIVDKSIAFDGGTCGIADVTLTAGPDDEVMPNVVRPAGFQVWNNDLLAYDYEADHGDPNEPLGAIRIVAPRGGAGSGKVVVGAKIPIKDLSAKATDLVAKQGSARIAAAAVQVRYSVPASYGCDFDLRGAMPFFFDSLLEVPPEEAKVGDARVGSNPNERRALSGAVEPVWVTVQVPPQTPPGDYRGQLAVSVGGQQIAVAPIELKVCRWKAIEPKDYVTFVDIVESPESVAMEYGAPLWSDEHLKLLAKSLGLLGQVGNKVCYVPLICDTNMGNDESMVRWIKQPDGSYKHDYRVMEKYLDAVEKYQGKPMVVCFQVWDAYLEGGLSEGIIYKGNIPEKTVADRRAHAGEGPIVSLLDEKTGKIEKHTLPLQSGPESVALWEPVIREIRDRMKKRGLEKAMMLGIMTDQLPTKAVSKFFNTVASGIPWTRSAHDEYHKTVAGLPMGYASLPYASKRLFAIDPSDNRSHGWRGDLLEVHFPRNIYNNFPLSCWRFMGEMNAAGELRGFARLGGDFFSVRNAKGQRGGILAARFPKSAWRMLDIQTTLLAPGKTGTIATSRFEVLREGLQECEARIMIDKALVDPAQRAKLGPELAQKAQDLLDGRVRDMRRAVSTLRATLEGTYKWPGSAYGDAWYMFPPVLGNFWYVSSGWQRETEKLYEMAAVVEAKLQQP